MGVIKTPHGKIQENVLPAGEIYIEAKSGVTNTVSIDDGADR